MIKTILASLWLSALILSPVTQESLAADATGSIGALGTLQPKSGFVDIVGRAGVAISELSVAVGDVVKKGQVLAVYDNKDELEHRLRLLEAELAELKGKIENDLALNSLTAKKSRIDLKRAQESLDSYGKLSKNAQANTVLTARQNTVGDASHALNLARTERTIIKKAFKLAEAIMLIRIDRAMKDFTSSNLRLPVGGTIMAIHRKVGESASGPIVTLADLTQMQIVGEVFEGDLARVTKGQKVIAKSKALSQELSGTIVRVGRRINAESKVAKIWIDLSESDLASRYIGMETNVSILP